MLSTNSADTASFLTWLQRDFPDFSFAPSSTARWSPSDKTIYFEPLTTRRGKASLLHELGHALLEHVTYHQDIQLLTIERQAWQKASDLAIRYCVTIDDDLIQTQLDSYRLWLHSRSRCPHCSHAGVQRLDLAYYCPLCSSQWTANDARQCSLKRYILPTKNTP